jgi:hypothetical protein
LTLLSLTKSTFKDLGIFTLGALIGVSAAFVPEDSPGVAYFLKGVSLAVGVYGARDDVSKCYDHPGFVTCGGSVLEIASVAVGVGDSWASKETMDVVDFGGLGISVTGLGFDLVGNEIV